MTAWWWKRYVWQLFQYYSVWSLFRSLFIRAWELLVWRCSSFQRFCWSPASFCQGKLFKSIGYWQLLGASDVILSMIRLWYKIPFISTPPSQHYKNNGSTVNECEFVGDAILELLSGNRIEAGCIVNSLSISVQSSGKKSLWFWDISTYKSTNKNLGVKIYIPLRTFFQRAFSFLPLI